MRNTSFDFVTILCTYVRQITEHIASQIHFNYFELKTKRKALRPCSVICFTTIKIIIINGNRAILTIFGNLHFFQVFDEFFSSVQALIVLRIFWGLLIHYHCQLYGCQVINSIYCFDIVDPFGLCPPPSTLCSPPPPIIKQVPLHSTSLCKNMARASWVCK